MAGRPPPGDAPPLVLASTSPRRLELLTRLGLTPARLAAPEIDEAPLPGELPRPYVQRVARAKAEAVVRSSDEVVLAGDTSIAVGRRILGKPEDQGDARRMLSLLSGRRHQCLSAVCVIDAAGRARLRVSATVVAFKRLEAVEIDGYLAGDEWRGKAGAYAIQGAAEAWVRLLSGSHSGVVGLPLFETAALLRTAGVLRA